MGYTQEHLAPGERIVYRTKLHRVIFLWPSILFLVSGAAYLSGFEIPGYLFLASALVAGFWIFFASLRSEFAVTNRKVIGKFAVDYFPGYPEVPLIEIRDVVFKPGILSSLFDYGTVVITDRRGARHKFSIVPAEFYKQVQARDARVRRVLQ